jgi:hypothetical protein
MPQVPGLAKPAPGINAKYKKSDAEGSEPCPLLHKCIIVVYTGNQQSNNSQVKYRMKHQRLAPDFSYPDRFHVLKFAIIFAFVS